MKKFALTVLALAAIATQFYPDYSEKKVNDSRPTHSSNANQEAALLELLGN